MKTQKPNIKSNTDTDKTAKKTSTSEKKPEMEKEIGGYNGPEPTRYGDWEINGRCSDF